MSRYMNLMSLLNDIDTEEKVFTFAMEHGLLYDKQSCLTYRGSMDLSFRMAVDGTVWGCHKRSIRDTYGGC